MDTIQHRLCYLFCCKNVGIWAEHGWVRSRGAECPLCYQNKWTPVYLTFNIIGGIHYIYIFFFFKAIKALLRTI